MSRKPTFAKDVSGLSTALPVLEDLPAGEIAKELVGEGLGADPPTLPDGRWAVAVRIDGLDLFAAGDDLAWTIFRPPTTDEADATAAASLLHRAIGGKHPEWEADR